MSLIRHLELENEAVSIREGSNVFRSCDLDCGDGDDINRVIATHGVSNYFALIALPISQNSVMS